MKIKTEKKSVYICEICEAEYDSKKEAVMCETKPVSYDRGLKVGDTVLATRREQFGGKEGIITSVFIIDKDRQSYAHNFNGRYWHTVGLLVKFEGTPFTRQLTFDDYEVIKK